MRRLNRYLLNRMQEPGISLEAVSPLYKAFSNWETTAALERQRMCEQCTRLKRPEQNEWRPSARMCRPPKWICDLAVTLGLTLRFWGVGDGPWRIPAEQWLSQQSKEGSCLLEDFRKTVSQMPLLRGLPRARLAGLSHMLEHKARTHQVFTALGLAPGVRASFPQWRGCASQPWLQQIINFRSSSVHTTAFTSQLGQQPICKLYGFSGYGFSLNRP